MARNIQFALFLFGVFGIIIGILFKIQDWPNQKLIFNSGVICLALYILMDIYFSIRKKK